MTEGAVSNLKLGLYRVWFHEDPSVCVVACVYQGARGRLWLAPSNWINPSWDAWDQVLRVELITTQKQANERPADPAREAEVRDRYLPRRPHVEQREILEEATQVFEDVRFLCAQLDEARAQEEACEGLLADACQDGLYRAGQRSVAAILREQYEEEIARPKSTGLFASIFRDALEELERQDVLAEAAPHQESLAKLARCEKALLEIAALGDATTASVVRIAQDALKGT